MVQRVWMVQHWLAGKVSAAELVKGLMWCVDCVHEQDTDAQIGPNAALSEHDACRTVTATARRRRLARESDCLESTEATGWSFKDSNDNHDNHAGPKSVHVCSRLLPELCLRS